MTPTDESFHVKLNLSSLRVHISFTFESNLVKTDQLCLTEVLNQFLWKLWSEHIGTRKIEGLKVFLMNQVETVLTSKRIGALEIYPWMRKFGNDVFCCKWINEKPDVFSLSNRKIDEFLKRVIEEIISKSMKIVDFHDLINLHVLR